VTQQADGAQAPEKGETATPDRRTRLVDAARELFFTRGYDATRMIDVARGAGFSKRTVYLEFESKDELFATICQEGVDIIAGWLCEVEDDAQPTWDVLRKQGEMYLRFYKDHHEYFTMLFLRANDDILSNIPEEQMQGIVGAERRGIEAIARTITRAQKDGLVRKDVDPAKQAVVGWCSLTGVLQVEDNGRRIDLSDGNVDELYWACFEMLLRGTTDWKSVKEKLG
jgi:AcrR family transcriptional regulator